MDEIGRIKREYILSGEELYFTFLNKIRSCYRVSDTSLLDAGYKNFLMFDIPIILSYEVEKNEMRYFHSPS